MKLKAFGLAAVAALALTVPASAHHSFAMFDAEKTVSVTGTVKEFEWVNPHSWLRVTVDDKATGRPAQWAFEMGSPGQQAQRGWKPDKSRYTLGRYAASIADSCCHVTPAWPRMKFTPG